MSAQTIYTRLTAGGLSHAGALGVMGNLQAESGLESCRLQGDYELSRAKSKEYAAKVDSGEISEHIFMYDAQGWGLAQWTLFTRKRSLLRFARQQGKSIGDMGMQLDFLLDEIKTYYPDLLSFLKKTTSIKNAAKRVCEEYERPAVNNIEARYQMALKLETQVKADAQPVSEYWPPRTVDKNMRGADVEVLQAILKARGYSIHYISGKFDALLEQEVKAFQSASGLTADGVCGPLTLAKALERR